eukprot:15397361-Alexandrium_andersonii.AAC.1
MPRGRRTTRIAAPLGWPGSRWQPGRSGGQPAGTRGRVAGSSSSQDPANAPPSSSPPQAPPTPPAPPGTANASAERPERDRPEGAWGRVAGPLVPEQCECVGWSGDALRAL